MSCYLAIESGRLWFLAQDFGLNYHQNSDTFIARSVRLQLTLNDFQKVSDKVPFLADLKPSGKYVMEDVHKIGGTPAIIRYYWNLGFKTRIVLRVFGAWKMAKYNGE